MTRAEYITSLIGDMGSRYSNVLPVKSKIEELAGKAFDALNPDIVELDDNYTLTHADSGKVITIATDAKTITLPATKKGLLYRIVNTGAAGDNIITVSPQAADGIAGTFTLAASVVVSAGTVNKDVINTKATAKTGDFVYLYGTGEAGTTAWVILGAAGIWAVQS